MCSNENAYFRHRVALLIVLHVGVDLHRDGERRLSRELLHRARVNASAGQKRDEGMPQFVHCIRHSPRDALALPPNAHRRGLEE